MKIVIARLRSFVRYQGPLETVLDSFFDLYLKWMKTRPDLEFGVYNISFDGTRPQRDLRGFIDSDIIVIPSDNEFRYWLEPISMNPKDLERGRIYMESIKPYLENKTIIMFRSDRGDTEDLYRSKTFSGVNIRAFYTIDELDFPPNIHGMKFWFLQRTNIFIRKVKQKYIDFGYWGNATGKDMRGDIIKQIYRDQSITQILVGIFTSGVKRNSKWIKKWSKLLPILEPCLSTLCFNWLDSTATTSRYPESIAIGLIPFVWRDYDSNSTYNITDWQRIYSFEQLKKKIEEIRDMEVFNSKFEEIKANYMKVLPTIDEYSNIFNNMMDNIIKRTGR